MPMDYSRGLSTEERKELKDIKKWSKIALWFAVASLIVAIVAIITALLC